MALVHSPLPEKPTRFSFIQWLVLEFLLLFSCSSDHLLVHHQGQWIGNGKRRPTSTLKNRRSNLSLVSLVRDTRGKVRSKVTRLLWTSNFHIYSFNWWEMAGGIYQYCLHAFLFSFPISSSSVFFHFFFILYSSFFTLSFTILLICVDWGVCDIMRMYGVIKTVVAGLV